MSGDHSEHGEEDDEEPRERPQRKTPEKVDYWHNFGVIPLSSAPFRMMVPLPFRMRSCSVPARRGKCYMLDREDTEDLFPLWRTTDAHQNVPFYGDIWGCSTLGCRFRPMWRPHFVTTCSWRTGLSCPVCGCVSVWPLTFPYDRRPLVPPAFAFAAPAPFI